MSKFKDYAPLLLRLENACLKFNTDPKTQLNGLIEMIESLTCEPIYKNIDIAPTLEASRQKMLQTNWTPLSDILKPSDEE